MLLEVLLITLLNTIYSQEIQYPFTISRSKFLTTNDLFDNYLIGKVCLGKPKQCFNMGFSIKTYFIWFCQKLTIDRLYDKNASSSYIDLNKRQLFETQETAMSGQISNETFYVNNYTTPQTMTFILSNERPCAKLEIDGEIGLNSLDILHGSPRRLSFLDQANITNVKYPNAIGIRYYTNNSGLITFGVDNDEITSNNAISIGTSPNTARYFDNVIEYLTYKEQKVITKTYMLFRFENKATVLPSIIYAEFKEKIVPLLFINDACVEELNNPHFSYFLCKKDFDRSHFVPLTLTFWNNDTYYIDLRNQFIEFGVDEQLLFAIIGTKGYNNQIEIGDIFFRNFYIILERTNHTMFLIPNHKMKYNEQKPNANEEKMSVSDTILMKTMQILAILFLIFFIGYILMILRNKKRNEGNQYLLK